MIEQDDRELRPKERPHDAVQDQQQAGDSPQGPKFAEIAARVPAMRQEGLHPAFKIMFLGVLHRSSFLLLPFYYKELMFVAVRDRSHRAAKIVATVLR